MYGPGCLSLRSLAATASADGVCEVSDVALLKRLRGAKDWLSALCRDVLARGAGVAEAPSVSARPIRIVDSSRLAGPGKRAWRLHLSFDPLAGRIADARITGLDQGERLDRLPPQVGAIYLADRGYPQPDGLRRLVEAGADALVRLTWNSLSLRDEKDRALDWPAIFAASHAKGGVDMPVTVRKSRGKFAPLPMRMVVTAQASRTPPPRPRARERQQQGPAKARQSPHAGSRRPSHSDHVLARRRLSHRIAWRRCIVCAGRSNSLSSA